MRGPTDPRSYRDAHPRLYGALIARHGGPNETQLTAGPVLDAGHDALVMAPTASGKTEAVLVPLLERHVPDGADRPRVLIVSPTRALVNDLARRIAEPLERIGMPVGRWTGDHHDKGRMQVVTVLTPEALDARIARSADLLRDVGALVLDELHVLDGSVRGDQLRVLVQRLRGRLSAIDQPLQVVGASATVPEPLAMAERYLAEARIVSAGDRRVVRAKVVQDADPAAIQAELLTLVRTGLRKVLCFCDTREAVERLARALRGQPPFGHEVLAHHGSLSRRARLQAEERFRTAPVALCVATSTLEVGLDIGDVDLVCLVGVPPDVPALVQRVGRGGRRTGRNVAVVFAGGPFQAVAARAMLEAQARGDWLHDPVPFHPAVLAQQAISVAGGRGRGVTPAAMRRRLPMDLAAEWTEERLAEVLRALCEAGLLMAVGEGPRCVLGEEGEALWSRGQVHANIGGGETASVVDGLTGEEVGRVDAAQPEGLSMAGTDRSVLLREEGRIVTRAGTGDLLPSFTGGQGPVMGPTQARALLAAAGIPVPCRARLDGGETVFHGLGTAGGRILARALRERGSSIRRAGPLAVVLRGAPFDGTTDLLARQRWPAAADVQVAFDDLRPALAQRLGLGPLHAVLPAAVREPAEAAHARVSAVERFVMAGLPPLVDPEDWGLWDAAAWA
ncbi:MAG: DEAD/DEAH box helicase [Alphaproteobacteria bacterium]|nr:DEAD/DEAH box helicase [Alphaproteobacteria bacterium]